MRCRNRIQEQLDPLFQRLQTCVAPAASPPDPRLDCQDQESSKTTYRCSSLPAAEDSIWVETAFHSPRAAAASARQSSAALTCIFRPPSEKSLRRGVLGFRPSGHEMSGLRFGTVLVEQSLE